MTTPVHLDVIPAFTPYSLVIHAGAGRRPDDGALSADETDGLTAALRAGEQVLAAGGSALDAVTAAVIELEDCPRFNAGRGAALTAAGTAELDACICDGTTGRAGAVAGATRAKNPVTAARAVMERTPHVLLIDPSPEWLAANEVAVVDPSYFITPRARAALERKTGSTSAPVVAHPAPATPPVLGHGTVGAVARDQHGNLAAATSTGGVTGQWVGRVGDTPIVGAGTWADARVAVSCTGIGEYFIRGAVAHDLAARIRYLSQPLPDAAPATLIENVATPGGDGGLIAIDAAGHIVTAFVSGAMLRGYLTPDGPRVAVLP